jgi:hypothetical protein
MATVGTIAGIQNDKRLRHLCVGDVWEWSVTGGISYPNGAVADITQGGMRVTVERGPAEYRVVLVTQMYIALDGAPTRERVLRQTIFQGPLVPDLEVVEDVTMDGTHRKATSCGVYTPGNWHNGMTTDSTLSYDNGDVEHRTCQVVGAEAVTVTAGVYDAWIARETSTDQKGSATLSTAWYVPHLGCAVKTVSETTSSSGNKMTYLMTLVSTNVRGVPQAMPNPVPPQTSTYQPIGTPQQPSGYPPQYNNQQPYGVQQQQQFYGNQPQMIPTQTRCDLGLILWMWGIDAVGSAIYCVGGAIFGIIMFIVSTYLATKLVRTDNLANQINGWIKIALFAIFMFLIIF